MFIGGCAGSTACGIKIFRLQMLVIFFKNQIKRIISPNSIMIMKYNNQKLQIALLTQLLFLFSLFYLYILLLQCFFQ